MIKSFSFLSRKNTLSHEEFVRHWTEVHAPMFKDVPGLRGYILNIVIREHTRSDVQPLEMSGVDGIAQLWFDDLDARARATASDPVRRWHADGATIIGEIKTFVTEETKVVALPRDHRPPIKVISVLMRQDGATEQAFQHHWRAIHAPMAHAIPHLAGFVLSGIIEEQFRSDIPTINTPGPIDGFAESWAESAQTRAAMVASPEAKAWFADGALFIGRAKTLVTEERVFLAPP